MSMIGASNIPSPKDWQDFQRLMKDLFKEIWNDPFATEFGRSGQKQHGIDIIGTRSSTQQREAVQCKVTDNLTEQVIQEEYEKIKSFPANLDKFIIATTAPRNARAQEFALRLSDANNLRCELLFWDDIKDELSNYVNILRKYYPQFIVFVTTGDTTGRIVYVDIETTHYELLITKTPSDDKCYGNLLLVADLLNMKCKICRIGDHWSRLDGFIGCTRYDAFVISKWLNSFRNQDILLNTKPTTFLFEITPNEEMEFYKSIRG